MGADERLYFFDDEELGIRKNALEEHHFQRSTDRYNKAIKYCGRKGGLWLDAACGSGYGTEIISKVADYVVGIDIEPITIKYAQKYYGKHNIHFRVGDINNLEFDIESMFDIITGLEIIEHVHDCTHFLRRAYKILKPGGVLIVTTPISERGGPNPLNKYHLNELTRDGFTKLTSDIFDFTEYVVDDPVLFTSGELTRQIFGICRKREV
ncbi:MAG: class I SAM-dependent methyltransferase [Dehalococcoidales bacterium]|nr:class I SAM-dependent methyltransferase [Dehalococcoidales bacterium]